MRLGLSLDPGRSEPGTPQATITSVSAGWIGAAGGDAITITGTGFSSGAPLALTANGVPCMSVVFVNATTLTAVTPAQTI